MYLNRSDRRLLRLVAGESIMLKNIINASIGVMAGVSLLLSAHTTKSDEIWNMATAWGGGPFLEEDAKGYAKLVDTLTDGRIEISVFPGGTLGSPLKVSDTVKSNVVQAGHTWMGYDCGIDKTTDEWADEQAARDVWFKRVLQHCQIFQKNMENWPRFRFSIGRR